jgi:hypothetical protein
MYILVTSSVLYSLNITFKFCHIIRIIYSVFCNIVYSILFQYLFLLYFCPKNYLGNHRIDALKIRFKIHMCTYL